MCSRLAAPYPLAGQGSQKGPCAERNLSVLAAFHFPVPTLIPSRTHIDLVTPQELLPGSCGGRMSCDSRICPPHSSKVAGNERHVNPRLRRRSSSHRETTWFYTQATSFSPFLLTLLSRDAEASCQLSTKSGYFNSLAKCPAWSRGSKVMMNG